jgi:hypothetical protein
MMGDDELNVGLAGGLRSRHGHFVDEQVGADKPVDRLAHEPRRLRPRPGAAALASVIQVLSAAFMAARRG